MGYVGKAWIQGIVVSLVCAGLSFLFRMHWSWIGVHIVCLMLCFRSMMSYILKMKTEEKEVQKLYETMTGFIVSYRQNRHVIQTVRLLKNDFDVDVGDIEKGNVEFETLRKYNRHYLWHSIVNLVEIDVHHGDPSCIQQMYELEEEVDVWYQAIYQFTLDRNRNLQTMCILVLFSLFVAWMVMNMLHSVLPLYQTSLYQLVVGIFILCLQLFLRFVFKQHRMILILEVECVS